MKKILAILFTISLAYITSYYTTDASANQEPFSFENNTALYKLMCFINGETDTTDAKALYRRAEDYYYYKDYELAIKDYEAAIRIDSTRNYGYMNIADCYLELNDTIWAISVLEKYAKVADYKDEVLSKLAEINLALGNIGGAKANLMEAASINKSNHRVKASLAKLFIREKKYKKALPQISYAINLYNESTEYLNIRRELYLKLNKTDLAKADYERIIKLDAYFFPNYAEKAKTAKENGNIQAAIGYYKQALAFDPKNKEYINSRGWLYEELKQYDSAYYDFDTLVQLEPENYYYYFNRAYVLDGLGRIKEAIKDYTTSIKYKADYHLTYNNRGYEYYQLKKYKEAEKDYTKSIELKSDYYLSYLNRGLMYHDQKKYERAITDYKNAMQYSENNTTVIYNLALAYDKTKKAEKAVDYFNEYLKLEEDIDSTTYNYVVKRIAELSNQ